MKKYPFIWLCRFLALIIVVLGVGVFIIACYTLSSKEIFNLWCMLMILLAGMIAFAIILDKDEENG